MTHGVFHVPAPKNEPVLGFAPGSPERAAIRSRLNAMALESWKNGEIRKAMTQLEAAIDADPDDPEMRTHYGRLLLLSMSYGDAREQLENAAQLNPNDPQVWLDLATLYQNTMALELSWEARGRAEALAEGREIRQDEMGFWVLDGNTIYP